MTAENSERRSREHPADARRAHARRGEAAESRKATVAELLAQDRQKLLMKLPFTGSLVMRLDLVPVSDVGLETASTDGDRIFLAPALPKAWNVDFKLYAAKNTTVQGVIRNGKVESLTVDPPAREKDVEICLESSAK